MTDVATWRRQKRTELYAARKAMTAEQRYEAARKIAIRLDDHCIRHKPELIGLYWPIKYEPNLLAWARRGRAIYDSAYQSSSRGDNRSNIGAGRQAMADAVKVFGASRSPRAGTW